jgi:hypothetical protein
VPRYPRPRQPVNKGPAGHAPKSAPRAHSVWGGWATTAGQPVNAEGGREIWPKPSLVVCGEVPRYPRPRQPVNKGPAGRAEQAKSAPRAHAVCNGVQARQRTGSMTSGADAEKQAREGEGREGEGREGGKRGRQESRRQERRRQERRRQERSRQERRRQERRRRERGSGLGGRSKAEPPELVGIRTREREREPLARGGREGDMAKTESRGVW